MPQGKVAQKTRGRREANQRLVVVHKSDAFHERKVAQPWTEHPSWSTVQEGSHWLHQAETTRRLQSALWIPRVRRPGSDRDVLVQGEDQQDQATEVPQWRADWRVPSNRGIDWQLRWPLLRRFVSIRAKCRKESTPFWVSKHCWSCTILKGRERRTDTRE